MAVPIVFFDIAGPDLGAQSRFYAEVFGWEIGGDGRMSVEVASPLPGTLRTDPAEKVLYLGVEDIDATLAKIQVLGGAVAMPRFVVPGVVILALFTDPAGNRMGLVEIAGGEPIVP